MKTRNLFRTIIIAGMFFIAQQGLKAQVTAPGWTGTGPGYGVAFRDSASEVPAQATNIDSVTIGSTMPYMVKGDLKMHQLRNIGALTFSDFNWNLSGGGTLRNKDASGAQGAKDTVVSVIWNTAGLFNLTVEEKPVVASGPAFSCTGTSQKLPIRVLPRPTITWGAGPSANGCNVDGTTITVPYSAAGTGQYTVTYRIHFTPLSGAASDVVASTPVPNLGNYTSGTQSFNISYAVPSGAYGKYEVFIENVTDRISRKSGITTSQAGDIPAAATTFYAYPSPTTQPIQHIKNI